jgi:DtxR family transcriptional regulator, Mn-dependent transcriptional regulator
MERSAIVEDYLKAIYELQDGQRPVPNGALLARFRLATAHYSAAAVTDMLKKLATAGLVHYEPYHGVRLTAAGEQIALEMLRHHRLLELYLVERMGVPWDQAHAEADVLEHVLSEALESRIAALLGEPRFDPHGAPIPTREGTLPQRALLPLSQVAEGERCKVAEVDDADPSQLRYLAQIGLVPQAAVTIRQRDPLDGPLHLLVGEALQIIGRRIADSVLVSKDTNKFPEDRPRLRPDIDVVSSA